MSRKQSNSPLKDIGGLVVSIYPDEAMEIRHADERILVSVERSPGSSSQCRIRILAARRIEVRKLSNETVLTVVRLLKGTQP